MNLQKTIILVGILFLSISCPIAEVIISEAPVVVDNSSNNSNKSQHLSDVLTRIVSESDGSIKFQDSAPHYVNNTQLQIQVDQIISIGVARLGINLERIISEASSSNPRNNSLVLSPTGIASVLALVLLGSGGKTFAELVNVLGLTAGVDVTDNTDFVHQEFGKLLAQLVTGTGLDTSYATASPAQVIPSNITVQGTAFASAIFLQKGYPVLSHFKLRTQLLYRSEVLTLDFSQKPDEAQEAINQWVQQKTRGRIPIFLSVPPSPATRVLLASALYFNGEWDKPFPAEMTKIKNWYGGKTREPSGRAIMMFNSGDYLYGTSARLGARVIALPYKDHAMAMYFVLPDEPGIEALNQFIHGLNVNDLDELITSVNEKSMIISIPRFKIQSTFSLKQSLKRLGVVSLFDPEQADLSFISPGTINSKFVNDQLIFGIRSSNTTTSSQRKKRQASPELYADDIIHKVDFEVTETGTVASAATALSITRDGSRKIFVADRPFLFFIRHRETGLILFLGRLLDPNQA